MSVASLAVHNATVQRKTVTKDTMGGQVESWARHIRISCRIQPLSAAEQQLYSRETEIVTHKIYVPGSPDIRHSDRIVFGSLTSAVANVSKTYLVRGVRNIDELGRFLTIEAELQT